jgi:hypothetical protein
MQHQHHRPPRRQYHHSFPFSAYFLGKRISRKSSSSGNALGHTRRDSELVTASAQGHVKAVRRALQRRLWEPAKTKRHKAVCIFRNYDATPVRVAFGTFGEQVAPHARYFALVDGQWKTFNMERYQALTRITTMTRGTLELFAQQWKVSWLSADHLCTTFEAICKPTFLQNGKASTIMSAIDSAFPDLDLAGIRRLSKEADLVFVLDLPDSCPATVRQRSWVKMQLLAVENVFTNPLPGCCVHQLHNLMTNSLRETEFTGDLHAIAITHAHVHQHNRVLDAFYSMLTEPDGFQWNRDVEPDPSWAAHTRSLLMQTLGRDVRGKVDSEGLSFSDARNSKTILAKIDLICTYVNCDTRPKQQQQRVRWIHFERGCGKCSTEAEARSHFASAAVEGGLIIEMGTVVPNSARWDTTHDSSQAVLPGVLILNISPSVTRRSFARWQDCDPGPGGENEDQRMYTKRKAYRSAMVLNNEGFQVKLACHFWVGRPVQWLWRRVEYLDAHGCSLFEVACPRVNPFKAARRQLVDMITKPLADSSLNVLLRHYERRPDLLAAVRGETFEMACSTISQLDFKLIWMLDDWPFPLLRGVADKAARRDLCAQFFAARVCDLEPFMSQKLRRRWATSGLMSDDIDFWAALGVWGRGAPLGNMNCERLLALIKCALPDRWVPSMEL